MATPIPSTAELLELMKAMSPTERAQLDAFLLSVDPAIWVPQDGPQTLAYHSPADIVFYGGSAGGGKTDLLLGLALTAQDHSIVFRREAVQLIGLEERMTTILGSRDGYNGQDHLWRLPGKKVLEFGSVQKPGDWVKYQGRAHDAKLFDEITHFTEMQFRTLIGWMRTDNPKVRQRVVCAGNPPTDPEGEWVKRYWAAWLDPQHPNPAKPGELRWYVTNEKGEDEEVPGAAPVMVGTELMVPKSRTFIPSSVDDNLFLITTGYKATLQALAVAGAGDLTPSTDRTTRDPLHKSLSRSFTRCNSLIQKKHVPRKILHTDLPQDACRVQRLNCSASVGEPAAKSQCLKIELPTLVNALTVPA